MAVTSGMNGLLSMCLMASMCCVLVVQSAPAEGEEDTCDATILSALYTYCKAAVQEKTEYERSGGAFLGNGYRFDANNAYLSRHRGKREEEDADQRQTQSFFWDDERSFDDNYVDTFGKDTQKEALACICDVILRC